MSQKTKKITTMAMLCAIAYVVTVVGRVPVVMFLSYEPKDVILALGGFIFGPLAAVAMSIIVSLVEMFTISDNGIIGFLMNVIASCAFVCPAAIFYKKMHNIKGAVIGLIVGCIAMTGIMILWNYIITPYYMHVPREEVVKLLVPAILPFNILKSGLNAAITILIYKPVVLGLRKARLLPASHSPGGKGKISVGLMLVAALVLASGVLVVLIFRGII